MVRTVVNNPFEPGSGAVPGVWVGRHAELADLGQRLVPRRSHGLFERGRTYLGDPGVGKSVLVNRIAQERRDAGDLVGDPLRLSRGRDPLAAMAQSVRALVPTGQRVAGRLVDALGRVERVGLLGTTVGLRPGVEDRYTALVDLLEGLALMAADQERLLVLRVDEVQNGEGDGLSQLLTILGDLLESARPVPDVTGQDVDRHLPVLLLLSGLPSFARRAAEAGATFTRRFATTYLQPFEDDEVAAALALAFTDGFEVLADDGPVLVGMTQDAQRQIVRACLGDPFLFQLAGAAAWDADTGPVITAEHVEAGWRRVRREVDAHVTGRIAGLTDLQLSVLAGAAALTVEDPAADGTAIARHIGRESSSQIGSTLQALVERQLLRLTPEGYKVVSRPVARRLAAS